MSEEIACLVCGSANVICTHRGLDTVSFERAGKGHARELAAQVALKMSNYARRLNAQRGAGRRCTDKIRNRVWLRV